MTRREWKRQKKKKQRKRREFVTVMSVLAVVITICVIDGAVLFGSNRQQDTQKELFAGMTAERQREASGQNATLESVRDHTETQGQQDEPDRYAVFDTMSADWGGENDGFVYHAIPEEYEDTGGYFPEKMQCYTYILCKQYGVDYSLVVALIERESGYVFGKTGDDGNSIGYMQIYESAHTDRMERLSVERHTI